MRQEVEFELLSKVEKKKEELVCLVRELVEIPSENTPPVGNELKCQEYIAKYMNSLSLPVDLYYFGDLPELQSHPAFWPGRDYSNRPNLAVRYKGQGIGKSLLLSGHIDTVPQGETHWKKDPFEGEIIGNRLYGLGAWDMKGSIGAMMVALKIMKELDIKLQGDLIFESVVDEEFAGVNGTIAGRLMGYNTDGAIIPEPSGLSICPATCGLRIVHITLRGEKGIMDTARSEVNNTVEQLAHFLSRVKEFAQFRKRKVRVPRLYEKCGDPIPVWVTKINMGTWGYKGPITNSGNCRIELYWQTMPGEEKEEVDREFFVWLKETIASRPELFIEEPQVQFPTRWMPGVMVDENQPLVSSFKSCVERTMQGKLSVIGMPSPSDMWVLPLHFKIPSLHFGPRGGNAHLPDEYVNIDDLVTLTKCLLVFAVNWCGLKG